MPAFINLYSGLANGPNRLGVVRESLESCVLKMQMLSTQRQSCLLCRQCLPFPGTFQTLCYRRIWPLTRSPAVCRDLRQPGLPYQSAMDIAACSPLPPPPHLLFVLEISGVQHPANPMANSFACPANSSATTVKTAPNLGKAKTNNSWEWHGLAGRLLAQYLHHCLG